MQPLRNDQAVIRVWDLFVRLFHWTLVLLFFSAYITGETHSNEIHLWLGYGLTGLLLARLVWGLIGTPYARFRSWLYSPAEIWRYVRLSLQGNPPHYTGHNPLGAVMVITLLLLLSVLVTTGLLLAGAIEFEGPLLAWTAAIDDARAYALLALHEIIATLMLGLVSLHVCGAIMASWQHHENLIRAMWTGYKKNPHPLPSETPAQRREQ